MNKPVVLNNKSNPSKLKVKKESEKKEQIALATRQMIYTGSSFFFLAVRIQNK